MLYAFSGRANAEQPNVEEFRRVRLAAPDHSFTSVFSPSAPSRLMSIRIHAAWSAGAALLLTGSRFLLLAILARRLDAHALGLYAYAQWMVDIGFLVSSFGATGAASRYIAEFRSRPSRMRAFLRLWRIPAFLLPMVGAFVAVLGARFTGAEVTSAGLGAMMVWALFSGLWGMQTSVLTGLQRFDLVFLANLLASMVMLLGVAIMPIAPQDPSSPFLIMGAGCAVAFTVGFLPVQRLSRLGDADAEILEMGSIIRYCMNIWITALLWSLVWSRGEVPLVRHFLGDAQLANYTVALSLVGGAIAGVMLGVGGIAPQVTRLLGDDEVEEAVKLCRKVGDWQLILSGGAAAILIWLAPELLRWAFGPTYTSAVPALGLLAAGLPALSFSMHNHFLQIQTGARFNRDTTLLGLVVLGVASILLIPGFGIEGAALARVSTLWLLAVVSATIFSSRAKPTGVNLVGFSTVTLVTATSAMFVTLFPDTPVWIRMPLALTIPLVLGFIIRDADGGLVINTLVRKVMR